MKSQFFSREFISQLPDDNDEAIVQITEELQRMVNRLAGSRGFDHDFLEVYALLDAFICSRELTIRLPPASPPNIDKGGVLAEFQRAKEISQQRLYQRDTKEYFDSKSEEYRALFSKTATYEFSDKDFDRIQQLINELRITSIP